MNWAPNQNDNFEVRQLSRATWSATFTFLAGTTTRRLNRRGFHRVASSIYRHNVTHVHALMQSILTFEFELLGFELVTLFHEIVDSRLTGHFDRLMRPIHIPKVLQYIRIELAHNELFVMFLELSMMDHLVDYFLKGISKRRGSVNFRLLLLVLSICICLISSRAFHHIWTKIRL